MQASDWIAKFLATQGVDAVYEVDRRDDRQLHRRAPPRRADADRRLPPRAGGGLRRRGARTDERRSRASRWAPAGRRDQPADGARQLPLRLDAGRLHHRPGQPPRAEARPARSASSASRRPTSSRWPRRSPRPPGACEIDRGAAGRSSRRRSRWRAAGRPGPVLVDIPLDLQRAEVDAPLPDGPVRDSSRRTSRSMPQTRDALLDDLAAAERPLILAGGGLRAGRAVGRASASWSSASASRSSTR